MPELPEVETVRAGLELLLRDAVIARIELCRRDLRTPMPRRQLARVAPARVLGIERRAKYLLIRTSAGTLLSHLGMTGSWRIAPPGDDRAHDHIRIHLHDGRRLVYRDPRRFGLFDVLPERGEHASLAGLGLEPLAAEFTADALRARCGKRRSAIKVALMDQGVVVGVGNIYAQEALFRAGIAPQRRCIRVDPAACARLVAAVRDVLSQALAAGGSTISDYRHADGSAGAFHVQHRVYGRGGLPCLACATPLRSRPLGGRSTVWCPRCQR